jgi:fatty acid desaturase
MSADTDPRLTPELSRKLHRVDYWRNVLRVVLFLFLYAAGASGAVYLTGKAGWWAALPFYILAGASLHGISLFAHEAVHGTLARNPVWNRVAGALCAIPVLQNCTAYRVLHLRHHKHLGDAGDPDHYANYTRWTWMVFCMNWLRLIAGYPIYIVAISFLGFRHGTTRDRLCIIAELAATALAVFGVFKTGISAAWLVHGWLVPMLFINTMVNIRGMSQHTLLQQTDDEVLGTRTILTSPLVRFFMCNENYHLEHHLHPGVPWHHLPEVHAALAPELRERGAPYIPTYFSFVREFFVGSIARAPWRK